MRQADPAVRPLAGASVLVTRPAARAGALVERLEEEGATALRFPVIAIEALAEMSAARSPFASLGAADIVIFVSPSAVDVALADALIRACLAPVRLGAVGAGTVRALAGAGFAAGLCPASRYDAEALLEHPDLAPGAVAGKRVVIAQGEGGRGILAPVLAQRGARVAEAVLYRRVPPDRPDVARIGRLGRGGAIDAAVVTSVTAAENLFALFGLPDRPWLETIAYAAMSERIVAALQGHGARGPMLVAERAGDEALIAALRGWYATRAVPR